MRDLYKALEVKQDADNEDIAAALKLKPEKSALAAILLDQRKRALYDSTYTTLKTIGELRRRLGLDNDRSWFLKNCTDFVPIPASASHPTQAATSIATAYPPQEETLAERVVGQNPEPKTRSGLHTAMILVSIVAILIFLFAWIY